MDRGARTRPAPAWSKNSNVDPESRQGLRYATQTGTLVPHPGTGWTSVDVCRAADGRRAWDALPVRARGGAVTLFHANDKWRRECRGISQSIQLGSKTALISTRNCNQVAYDCGLVGDTIERLGCLAVVFARLTSLSDDRLSRVLSTRWCPYQRAYGFGLRGHAALGRDGCHPILTTANQELEHSLRHFPFWSLSVERPPPSSEFRYVEYVQKACVRATTQVSLYKRRIQGVNDAK
ncbi:hypothetical protein B0T13DRAFT_504492 [Neurospora crassa]|nr:hypothetical protein B0T13DRAFT_504492 [Neurospora crassa]